MGAAKETGVVRTAHHRRTVARRVRSEMPARGTARSHQRVMTRPQINRVMS